MNMALEGETPYDNGNLYGYLARHMSIIKSNVVAPGESRAGYKEGDDLNTSSYPNVSFYTTDGMRFEFSDTFSGISGKFKLYENNSVYLRAASNVNAYETTTDGSFPAEEWIACTRENEAPEDENYPGEDSSCSYCGSYGLNSNSDDTKHPPCLIVVDVNGDRKPFPQNSKCYFGDCTKENIRKYADPNGKKLTDTFPIMITDKQAIPYGVAAQKAMYEAQK